MLYFNHCTTLDQLKAEYRRLCLRFHPDSNSPEADTATMAAINAEHDRVFEQLKAEHNRRAAADPEHKTRFTTETPAEFRDIVAALLKLDGLTVELCGSWLWVTGNTFPNRERLKEAGYRFSKNKVAWYWHDENSISHSKKRYSLDEIRLMHGSETLKNQGGKLGAAQVGITLA